MWPGVLIDPSLDCLAYVWHPMPCLESENRDTSEWLILSAELNIRAGSAATLGHSHQLTQRIQKEAQGINRENYIHFSTNYTCSICSLIFDSFACVLRIFWVEDIPQAAVNSENAPTRHRITSRTCWPSLGGYCSTWRMIKFCWSSMLRSAEGLQQQCQVANQFELEFIEIQIKNYCSSRWRAHSALARS